MATSFPAITHTISADAARSSEGRNTTLTFTVMRTGNLGAASTVNWFVGGTVDAADFGGKLPTGRLSFGVGEFAKTIVLRPTDDNAAENDETVTVTLGALTGNGAVLGAPRQASMTLGDNDVPPTVSIASAQVVEGEAGATSHISFVLSRVGNLGGPTEVVWSFTPWSSTLTPADFAGGVFPQETRVTFAPGAATLQVDIAIAGDATIEGDEEFILTIAATKFGQNGETRAVGTILTDDTDNTFDVTAGVARVQEGDSGTQVLDFTITRSGNSAAPVMVKWTRTGTLGTDDLAPETPAEGLLDFGAGETVKTLRFELAGDVRTERDETLQLTLVSANGLGAGLGAAAQASTVVTSDDPRYPVTVFSQHLNVAEGAPGATLSHRFTLTRSGDLGEAASIAWHLGGTLDGEELAHGTATSGRVSFAPGVATAVVTLETVGDSVFEPDDTLVFSLDEGDLLGPAATGGTATVTVLNDDEPDEFRIIATTPVLLEGSVPGAKTAFRLDLVRAGHVDTEASVQYAVTGSGVHRTDAADFGGAWPSGTMKWFAGEARKTLYISASQDTLAEFDEGFTVTLFNGVGAGVSPTQGQVELLLKSDEWPGPRSITGSSAVNERISLRGPHAAYTIGVDAATDGVRLIDTDPGRSGTLTLQQVELVVFADQVQLRLLPSAEQKSLLQLGQALRGPQGLDTGLYTLGLEVLPGLGLPALAAEAAAAFFGSLTAPQMAAAVLANLGLTARALGASGQGEATLQATEALLTSMFSGDAPARGQALLAAVQALAGLESDASYGAAAAAFNNRVAAEWLAEFAAMPVSLTGLPDTWVELAGG